MASHCVPSASMDALAQTFATNAESKSPAREKGTSRGYNSVNVEKSPGEEE